MKRFVSFSLSLVITILLLKTPVVHALDTNIDSPQAPATIQYRGITVNKLNFEVIKDITTMPAKVQETIESLKSQRGFYVFDNSDGTFENNAIYVLICSGEQPTAGYGIIPILAEDVEGISNIVVKELKPSSEMMVPQVATYPYALIKFEQGTGTPNVIVQTEDTEKLTNLNLDGWKLLPRKTDVEEVKEWSIRFNKEVIADSLNDSNVYVTNVKGNKIPVMVSLGEDNLTIKISPVFAYKLGETYFLYISKNVNLSTLRALRKGYKMEFTIRDAVAIE